MKKKFVKRMMYISVAGLFTAGFLIPFITGFSALLSGSMSTTAAALLMGASVLVIIPCVTVASSGLRPYVKDMRIGMSRAVKIILAPARALLFL